MSSQIAAEERRERIGLPWRISPVRAAAFGFLARLLGAQRLAIACEPPLVDPHWLVWPSLLAVNASVALIVAAAAANRSRAGDEAALGLFYASVAILFLPFATRLVLPRVSRAERIVGLLLVTFALYLLRTIRAPVFFLDHDEFLHWTSAAAINETGRLFAPNVLFPIGPSYPGLEVVTNALSSLSGLSIFSAAFASLAVARLLYVAALFLFYEKVSGSARVASVACILNMGSSTFVFFDTAFSYESMALPLLVFALVSESWTAERLRLGQKRELWLLPLVVLALAMTHHATAYGLALLLIGALCFTAVGATDGAALQSLGLACICATAFPWIWSWAMGDPGSAYLGPIIEDGLRELRHLLSFDGVGRRPFASEQGMLTPLWQRATALVAVALICVGLALSFFRSLAWAGFAFGNLRAARSWRSIAWRNGWLAFLTFLSFAYPVSMLLRLTRSGWEIGNRIGPFAFIGVGLVLSIGVATLFQRNSESRVRAATVGAAATMILIGGIISSAGLSLLVPAKYQVEADAASIEPMGIGAAEWAKDWLGPRNRFAADRDNRLLLSTFGQQLVSTTLQLHDDAGVAMISETFGPEEAGMIHRLGLDYLLADLRITTGRPVVGAYFDSATADEMLSAPPSPGALLKFNAVPGVNRVFDNGYIVIYDVRAISGRK